MIWRFIAGSVVRVSSSCHCYLPSSAYSYKPFQLLLTDTNEKLASGIDGWGLKEDPGGTSKNRWKSYSAVASDQVPGEAFRTLANNTFFAKPYSRRYMEIKPLRGAIGKLAKNATAFWHRDALWWSLSSHFYASTDKEDFVSEILQSSRDAHEQYVQDMGASYQGGYAGYIDHSNSSARDLERYYGGNAARILEIKNFRDPHRVFRNYLPNNRANAPFDLRDANSTRRALSKR